MVHGYCLIQGEVTKRYPNIDERQQIEDSGGMSAKPCTARTGVESIVGTRSSIMWGGERTLQTGRALLFFGVNKSIQQEAANVLFGMNV